MIKSSLAFVLIFACLNAFSQSYTGIIFDSVANKPLENAVVYLLTDKHKLAGYTRSDQTGKFIIKGRTGEGYTLLITSPLFADYLQPVGAPGEGETRLGKLFMTPKIKLLQEVIIAGKRNFMRLKNDTLTYLVDSIRMRPNATVEDLLKLLPGMLVDKDGKIMFQGEQVKRVLVDGEEFFGEDPTIATKYLNADWLKEIQVYDKKSQRSELTGFDDGRSEKVIDLKIKEEKKNGYFGKIGASGNLAGRYENMMILNSFSGNRQFSVFGHLSNTLATGLQPDYESFDGAEVSDAWSGPLTEGIPSSYSAGARYANKWSDMNSSLSGSCIFSHIDVDGNAEDIQKFNLPDTSYTYRQNTVFHNLQEKQAIKAKFETNPDSASLVSVSVNGNIVNTHLFMHRLDSSFSQDAVLINDNDQQVHEVDHSRQMSVNFYYQRKLNKKGRSFYVKISPHMNQRSSSGDYYSQLNYYNNNKILIGQDTVDQVINSNQKSGSLETDFFYSEPVSANSILTFSYNLNTEITSSSVLTYDKNGQQDLIIDSAYSTDYRLVKYLHLVNVDWSVKKGRIEFTAGSQLFDLALKNTDPFNGNFDRSYFNYSPKLLLRFRVSPYRSIEAAYSGILKVPEISQLQPVRNNTDPLNITIGNEQLKPSYQHNFSLRYGEKMVSRKLFLSVKSMVGIINNDFSTIDFIDSVGRNVSMATNVKGNYFLNGTASFSKGFPGQGQLQLNAEVMHRVSMNYVNSLPNRNNANSVSLEAAFYKSIGSFDFGIRINPRYNALRSDQNTSINSDYWYNRIALSAGLTLPAGARLYSQCVFVINPAIAGVTSAKSTAVWDAGISQSFLKKKNLELAFKINDILGQNEGISRDISGNVFTQHTYETLRRYWMFSVVWSFSKGR